MAIVLSCPNTGLRQEVSKRAVAALIEAARTRRPAEALPPWFSLQQRLQATLDEDRAALALSTSECRVLNALLAALDPDGELAQLAETRSPEGVVRQYAVEGEPRSSLPRPVVAETWVVPGDLRGVDHRGRRLAVCEEPVEQAA